MTLHWRGVQRRRTGEGQGPLQIIGTGLSRTGTLSTRIALDQLGVGPYHHIMGGPCAEQITFRTKATSHGFTDWNMGYADFGPRIDFPGGSVWKQTVTTFSGARVVHTERPEEEWWESFRDTFLKVWNAHETLHRHMPQQVQDTFAAVTPFYIDDSFDGVPNKDRAIAAYRRTNREVREAVSSDRLLVFSPSDGWGPLCAFVQMPEPTAPFPHRNSQTEFWSHFRHEQAEAQRRAADMTQIAFNREDKMTPTTNTSTAEINGPLWGARARDWAEVQEGQFAAAFHAVLAHMRVGPGTRHLDAGCGAGMAGALSASLGATVSGLDASDALLEIARERTPEGDFRQGDLEALPFADDSFDLVTGFNSFQYAGDAAQALREAGRVTRPGGRIVIMTWGEPAGMEAAGHIAAIKPLMPPPPPGSAGPFALSDETNLRAFAQAGGLTPREVVDVDTPWQYPDLAAALRGIASSGVAAKALAHSGEDAFTEAMTAFLIPFKKPDGSIGFGARARYLVATV